MSEYFTRQEALNKILNHLEDNDNANPVKLFDACFNTELYIIGRPVADEALRKSVWGIWGAIGAIEEYEKDLDGEISTDLSDPEQVANMLEYMIGEDVWLEIQDRFKDGTGINLVDFVLDGMDNDTQNKLIDFIKNFNLDEEPYDDTYLG